MAHFEKSRHTAVSLRCQSRNFFISQLFSKGWYPRPSYKVISMLQCWTNSWVFSWQWHWKFNNINPKNRYQELAVAHLFTLTSWKRTKGSCPGSVLREAVLKLFSGRCKDLVFHSGRGFHPRTSEEMMKVRESPCDRVQRMLSVSEENRLTKGWQLLQQVNLVQCLNETDDTKH